MAVGACLWYGMPFGQVLGTLSSSYSGAGFGLGESLFTSWQVLLFEAAGLRYAIHPQRVFDAFAFRLYYSHAETI